MADPKLTPADIKAVIRMEPKDVIAYFSKKGFKITWNWQEALDAVHARVFTVAKVTRIDILQAIQDALTKAMEQGQTYKQFADDITPILQQKGWWGKAVDQDTGEITPANRTNSAPAQLGSPRRLWTIYQTNMQSAFMAGRHKAMKEAADTHPYWQYVAVMDVRTRPAHRALDGRVYRHDDPFWDAFYPPNGWNCRCRVRPVSSRSMEREQLAARSSASEPIRKSTVEIGSGPDMRRARISSFKSVDPGTGKAIIIKTDAGFNYNPGEAAWNPEAGRWKGKLKAVAKKELGNGSD